MTIIFYKRNPKGIHAGSGAYLEYLKKKEGEKEEDRERMHTIQVHQVHLYRCQK